VAGGEHSAGRSCGRREQLRLRGGESVTVPVRPFPPLSNLSRAQSPFPAPEAICARASAGPQFFARTRPRFRFSAA
jgi:hypothetical protein